jgi:hypothetical protein
MMRIQQILQGVVATIEDLNILDHVKKRNQRGNYWDTIL